MTDEQRNQDNELIIARLAAAGVTLAGDLYSLANDPQILSRAAPILLELLDEVRSPFSRVHLVRVASGARVSPGIFIDRLRNLRPDIEAGDGQAAFLAWTLAEALRRTADETVFSDLVEILSDRRFGRARQMLPYALARVRAHRSEVVMMLVHLLDAEDPDVTVQVLDVLGIMKALEAVDAVRPYLDSPNSYIRAAARKTTKKLEKEPERRSAPPAREKPIEQPVEIPNDLGETSANFDLGEVATLLRELSSIVDGLGPAEIDGVEARLTEMEADEEETFNFTVRYGGEATPLLVRAYADGAGGADVAFSSKAPLTKKIEELIDELD